MSSRHPERARPAPLALAAAALAPLLAWSFHFALIRGLAPVLCGLPTNGWLYALTLLALAAAVGGGAFAWFGYRRALAGAYAGRDAVSARYFGLVGAIAGAIFAVGIAAQTWQFHQACG
jgi:hypothetical protein